MKDGWSFLFLLFFFTFNAHCASHKKDSNKYYTTYNIPAQYWDKVGSDGNLPIPYRHEIVSSGPLDINIRKGSNYSVHPTMKCEKRISFVIQMQPKDAMKNIDNYVNLQTKTCTISITIDDGHVEVWYGLCTAQLPPSKRKFDFPLNPMSVVYFDFDKLTMRIYRKDSDYGPGYEMGRIEHVSIDKKFRAFETFKIFLYHDACTHVSLKEVYTEDEWRHAEKEKDDDKISDNGVLLFRMTAIFALHISIGCLILSTMHIWSIGVPFPTNGIYDTIFARYNTKTGAIARTVQEDQKSCRSAEEPSEEWEGTGRKENLFAVMDKGKQKAPMRAPPGYALPSYDMPYEDDPDPGLQTAIFADSKEEITIPERAGGETPQLETPYKPSQSTEKAPKDTSIVV